LKIVGWCLVFNIGSLLKMLYDEQQG